MMQRSIHRKHDKALLLLLGGCVNGIEPLHQGRVAVMVGAVPGIHIHGTAILRIQDFQGLLQLLCLS